MAVWAYIVFIVLIFYYRWLVA